MERVTRWFSDLTGLTYEFVEHLLITLLVLLGLWLLSRITLSIVFRQEKDLRKRYKWRKFTNYTITIIGIILLVNIWLGGLRSVATFLGLLSAGLVLALREPVLNMAAWVFIIWKRPFRVGDRIQVGEYAGDVIDQRLFQFTINEIDGWVDADQATGRIVHIPNLKVFTEPQANYNYGFPFIWNEVTVRITFESNWQRAKAILTEIVQRHCESLSDTALNQVKKQSQQHLIFYENFNPHVYTDVLENGIRLTMRYMCSIMRRRKSEEAIWEDVLKAFATTSDIQFAYPTTRFYTAGESHTSPGTAP
ncbi:mechanosensitive ion channel family protein [Pontibacter cellulosilyticus]|uniref:Mechanosensitive ion channel family protein n=1 Tax=Pontibacter cellulosilyticus TaxID=1720253 RepID=A0A923SMC0_9BACT|nr:mechanosensitive ion channel family protein [Pontibacter cellulosilyticus]MBC5992035.1 mechanosensitive ion channel family protein [Pontibacter cellulosilyticus]